MKLGKLGVWNAMDSMSAADGAAFAKRVEAWATARCGCRTVAWGDEAAIRARIQEHWDAGADHVCIQTIRPDGARLPDEPLLALLAPGTGG
jgi:hypothetical protein